MRYLTEESMADLDNATDDYYEQIRQEEIDFPEGRPLTVNEKNMDVVTAIREVFNNKNWFNGWKE